MPERESDMTEEMNSAPSTSQKDDILCIELSDDDDSNCSNGQVAKPIGNDKPNENGTDGRKSTKRIKRKRGPVDF